MTPVRTLTSPAVADPNPEPAATANPYSSQDQSWLELVEKIKKDDPAGMEELYRVFSKGIRFFLCRQLGPRDLDDKVHDAFLIVALAIRRGDLREPERLMGYVRTVVRRQVASHIEQTIQERNQHLQLDFGLAVLDNGRNPEQDVMTRQQEELAMKVLRSIPTRDREILVRFYLEEQTPERICQEMGLTETQFRLLKSRAKARFGELGKRKLARRKLFPFS